MEIPRVRGDVTHCESDKLITVTWLDKKPVRMLSNCHDGTVVDSGKKTRDGQPMRKPKLILDYNTSMGAVDRADQLLHYYPFMRKTLKWYKKLGLHLIDVAILNAQILWNKKHDTKVTLLKFRLQLVDRLLEEVGPDPNVHAMGGRQQIYPRPARLTGRHFPQFIASSGKREVAWSQCRVCNVQLGRRCQPGETRKRVETK